MNSKIFLGASLLALVTAFPAFAQTNQNATAGAKAENALERAGDAISETANKAAVKTKEAYQDVKAYFSDDANATVVTNFNMAGRVEADRLIGATVENPAGENIGKVEDILINSDGDAEVVIISDGGVLGLGGKNVAFDYDIMEGVNANDNIVVRLTEKSIEQARAFEKAPADRHSVKQIIGSKVMDANGKAVADVETLAFEGDDAEYLIVSFNKVLGMGGSRAALNFDALDMVNNNGKYSFKLNSQQTAQFESEKESAKRAN